MLRRRKGGQMLKEFQNPFLHFHQTAPLRSALPAFCVSFCGALITPHTDEFGNQWTGLSFFLGLISYDTILLCWADEIYTRHCAQNWEEWHMNPHFEIQSATRESNWEWPPPPPKAPLPSGPGWQPKDKKLKWSDLWARELPVTEFNSATIKIIKTKSIPALEMAENCF